MDENQKSVIEAKKGNSNVNPVNSTDGQSSGAFNELKKIQKTVIKQTTK